MLYYNFAQEKKNNAFNKKWSVKILTYIGISGGPKIFFQGGRKFFINKISGGARKNFHRANCIFFKGDIYNF